MQQPTSFIGRWLEILRPGYERVTHIEDPQERLRALEKEAIATSIDNLSGFPFITEAIENEDLQLHGVFFNISEGELEVLAETGRGFAPV